jgi:hypothetical protein
VTDLERPLLRDVAPELSSELRLLLVARSEPALAAQVDDLSIVERCRCGDDFCASFYTAPPQGIVNFTVALDPAVGMLNVDVIKGRSVFLEVLYRDDVKAKIDAAVP